MTGQYARVSSMTAEEVRAEFERWTFRMPGYSWRLRVDEHAGPPSWSFRPAARLEITVTTQDSYGEYVMTPGTVFHVVHAYTVELLALTPDRFAEWIRSCISTTVLHEAMEWVRRDGVMLWNPHEHETSR